MAKRTPNVEHTTTDLPDDAAEGVVDPIVADDAPESEDDLELVSPKSDADAIETAEASVAPAEIGREHLKHVIESLVFVSDRPISLVTLARHVKAKASDVQELLEQLINDYRGRGVELIEAGGGYQFRSAAVSAPFVRDLLAQRPVRLTRAQLETLALVAYRQPVTRPEIDDVRGVDSGSALKVLLERGLLKLLGRKDEAGRPLLYGTTPFFLEFFGMRALKDLPTLREFSDLSDESRELFKRKLGEPPQEILATEPSMGDESFDPDEEDAMPTLTPNADAESEDPQPTGPTADDDADDDDDLDDDDLDDDEDDVDDDDDDDDDDDLDDDEDDLDDDDDDDLDDDEDDDDDADDKKPKDD